MEEALFTKTLKAGKNTYSFNVRTASSKNKYLTITSEFPIRSPRGGREEIRRSTISLFPSDLQAFVEAFTESAEKMK